MRRLPGKPEVLAPAGDREALEAAVRAGADAVYLGVEDYNARIRATNFALQDLPGIVTDLHRNGVLVYVAFNTLLFEHEEREGRSALERIAQAGADAVIVQDLGVARWIHERARDLPIHASTQMTLSSREGIDFVKRLGVRRVILARELTIPEIRRIRSETDLELEVFVHGALCVSYSGQCLSSEAWGGRSANRGQCAQACRLPYDLIVDGLRRELGDRAYLLSPRDLEGYRRIPELVEAGVHGFKIEGRMKSAEYVAAATALYRTAVDDAWRHGGCLESLKGLDSLAGLEDLAEQARHVYSRGGAEGFLAGINHQILVDGRTRSHRGVRVGAVVALGRGFIELDLVAGSPRLSAGDGILIARSALEEDETGGKIFGVDPVKGNPRRIRIRFGRSMGPDPRKLAAGCGVYLTHDTGLSAGLRHALRDPAQRKQIPLAVEVTGCVDEPLVATYMDPEGLCVRAVSGAPLEEARRHPLDRAALEAHLGRLGGTRYRLDRIEVRLTGNLACPVSEMNRMRRDAVRGMEELRAGRRAAGAKHENVQAEEDRPDLPSPVVDAVARAEQRVETPASLPTRGGCGTDDPFLVLCRTGEQVRAALDTGTRRIILDFLDLVGLKDAMAQVRSEDAELTLALPRIQKPGEEKIWRFFLDRRPDAILLRNLASLEHLSRTVKNGAGPLLIGDVSLNAVNPSSVTVLLEAGCARVTPGLDLNGEQLLDLLAQVPPDRIEIPLHHHLPVFHTEHCVFAAFMSDGADWRTCGRPCDRHAIHLRDRTGEEHAVIADVGCRNTVFGARPQSAIHLLTPMRGLRVVHFRLELLEQDGDATRHLLSVYRAVWDGSCSVDEGLRRLRAEGRFGISRASAEPPRSPDWKPRGGRRPAPGRFRV